MKAVILAAGKGTRMRGLCNTVPKPLLPVANRPIISLVFSGLKQIGIRDVALVVGFEGHKLKSLVGDGSRYGVNVTYVWQKEQLGTGHATLICEEFTDGEPFVLIFGDILTPSDNYREMVKLFEGKDCDAVLSVFPVEDPSSGAAVEVRGGLVSNIVEKPPPGTVLNAYNNAGIFIWPPDIFDLIRDLERSPRGEYEFTDGILRFIEEGRRLAALELRGYWENISDPEGCIRTNRNILGELLPPAEMTTDGSAQLSKNACISSCRIAAGAVVGAGCQLEGCCLGEGCKLGQNVAAEYTEIQANAEVGKGCRLGPFVSVGEGAVIRAGATVGPNVSVGPGCAVGASSALASSILLDGSTAGRGCSIVHAMLDFNARIGAGETVSGTPEKAVEVLTRQSDAPSN